MAQSGMFRNAFRGFNKQDVLQYIDEITAAWDEERKELEAKANAAIAAQEEAQTAAAEAQAQADAAVEAQTQAEARLAEVQQQLDNTNGDLAVAATTIEEMATQLEETQRRNAQLEQELSTTADERDAAIAALADAKEQLADVQTTRQQLDESRRQVTRLNDQMATMRATIQKYERILGNADTAAQQMDGIVRPFIDDAHTLASDTLDGTHAALTAILSRINDLLGDVEQRRQSLLYSKTDSDARLSATLENWLAAAQGEGQGSGFFQ